MTNAGFFACHDLKLNASSAVPADDDTRWQIPRGYFDRLILRGEENEPVSDEVKTIARLAEKHGLPIQADSPLGSPLHQYLAVERLLEQSR